MTRHKLGMMLILAALPSGIAIATMSTGRCPIDGVQLSALNAMPVQIKSHTRTVNVWVDQFANRYLAATIKAEDEADAHGASEHPLQKVVYDTHEQHQGTEHEESFANNHDETFGNSADVPLNGSFVRLAGWSTGGLESSSGDIHSTSHSTSSGVHVSLPDRNDAGSNTKPNAPSDDTKHANPGSDTNTSGTKGDDQHDDQHHDGLNPHSEESLPLTFADVSHDGDKSPVGVPEPASLTLFSMALLGLRLSRRKSVRAA